MHFLSRRLAVVLATGAAFGATGAAAQAQPYANVVAAIKNQTRIIRTSPANKALAHLRFNSPASVRAGLPALARFHATIAYAAADVSHATTQSPVQLSAKRKWVKGTRDEAAGIVGFESAGRAIIAGDKQRAKTRLVAGLRLLIRGSLLTNQADGLLDLAHDTRPPKIIGPRGSS
jgi:hypothetical protein